MIIRRIGLPVCEHYKGSAVPISDCPRYASYELQFDELSESLKLCEYHLIERVGKYVARPTWNEIRISCKF